MLQLSETFPTLDCAQCTLTPKTVETGQHPRIKLLTYSEVDGVEGKAGDFLVRISKKSGLCGLGEMHRIWTLPTKCPSKNPSEFDRAWVGKGDLYSVAPGCSE